MHSGQCGRGSRPDGSDLAFWQGASLMQNVGERAGGALKAQSLGVGIPEGHYPAARKILEMLRFPSSCLRRRAALQEQLNIAAHEY